MHDAPPPAPRRTSRGPQRRSQARARPPCRLRLAAEQANPTSESLACLASSRAWDLLSALGSTRLRTSEPPCRRQARAPLASALRVWAATDQRTAKSSAKIFSPALLPLAVSIWKVASQKLLSEPLRAAPQSVRGLWASMLADGGRLPDRRALPDTLAASSSNSSAACAATAGWAAAGGPAASLAGSSTMCSASFATRRGQQFRGQLDGQKILGLCRELSVCIPPAIQPSSRPILGAPRPGVPGEDDRQRHGLLGVVRGSLRPADPRRAALRPAPSFCDALALPMGGQKAQHRRPKLLCNPAPNLLDLQSSWVARVPDTVGPHSGAAHHPTALACNSAGQPECPTPSAHTSAQPSPQLHGSVGCRGNADLRPRAPRGSPPMVIMRSWLRSVDRRHGLGVQLHAL